MSKKNVEKNLRKLMDYQKFVQNGDLNDVIESTLYRETVPEDVLLGVSGGIGDFDKSPRNVNDLKPDEKIQIMNHKMDLLKKVPFEKRPIYEKVLDQEIQEGMYQGLTASDIQHRMDQKLPPV